MLIQNVSLKEAQHRFYEVGEYEYETESESMYADKFNLVQRCKLHYIVKELGVNIYEATCYSYNEFSKEYEPDFDLCIFYDIETGKKVHEQRGYLMDSILNFFKNLENDFCNNIKCNLSDL